MTLLGKIIVSLGIGIFTASTLAWISSGDWHWFAGGGAIFLASLATSAVVSTETKPSSSSSYSTTAQLPQPPPYPYPSADESWSPPPTPPPDESDPDPFSRPSQR